MSRLDDIRARVEAATKGPWERCENGIDHDHGEIIGLELPRGWEVGSYDDICGDNLDADLAFITAAREDIPYLLGLVERAKELARYICIHGNNVYAPLAEEFLRDVGREGS